MALRYISVLGTALWLALCPPAPAGHPGAPSPQDRDPLELLEAMKRDAVLWRDPGAVEALDFAGGPGGREGAPEPPFTFLDELKGGVTAKVKLRDARGRTWVAKWGTEVKSENIASRIAWAAGYFAEPVYYVAGGTIAGARDLGHAGKYIAGDGSFAGARFQFWDDNLVKKRNWTWHYNPFVGTRELSGLKIVLMLLSNWDNKDARDAKIGANTAIRLEQGASGPEVRYFIFDWGGSMGKWGLPGLGRDKWNCAGYSKQTAKLVQGVEGEFVRWEFSAWHDIQDGITLADLRWLLGYVGRISDAQLREGLEASGASAEEVECFTRAIRDRIVRLQQVAGAEETKPVSGAASPQALAELLLQGGGPSAGTRAQQIEHPPLCGR